jgi:prephenate dehydrogenase
MQKAGVVGFGRFGEIMAGFCQPELETFVMDPSAERMRRAAELGHTALTQGRISEMDILFLAPPIRAMEETLLELAPRIHQEQIVTDVCSVKVNPAMWMMQHLPRGHLLGSHPMFGPGTISQGFEGQKVAFCPLRIDATKQEQVAGFWQRQGCVVTETDPATHDLEAAVTQAQTFIAGRVLHEAGMPQASLPTPNYQALQAVTRRTTDNGALFHDLIYYNPFAAQMFGRLTSAASQVFGNVEEILAQQAADGLDHLPEAN